MNINVLQKLFSDTIRCQSVAVRTFHPERGVQFMLPGLSQAADGSCDLFVGEDSDLADLVNSGGFRKGVTYLISSSRKSFSDLTVPSTVNIFRIERNVGEIFRNLSSLLAAGDPLPQDETEKMYEDFWFDLTNGFITDHEQAVERISRFPYKMKEYTAVILLKNAKSFSSEVPLSKKRAAIAAFFPETNFFFVNDQCVVLFTQSVSTVENLDLDYDAFSRFLDEQGMIAGVSYPTRWYLTLKQAYQTAAASLDLGVILRNTLFSVYNHIYRYCEYESFYLIYLAAKRTSENNSWDNLYYLVHPDVAKLYFYDRTNNDKLMDILLFYLTCNYSIEKTAQKLHLHRNTLHNKLYKIQDIIGRKLDSFEGLFNVQLSCLIILYQIHYEDRILTEYEPGS